MRESLRNSNGLSVTSDTRNSNKPVTSNELKDKKESENPSLVTCYLLLCLFLALCCPLVTDVYSETLSPYAVEKISGQKAPDFSLKDMNGNPVSLSSFKGKVILLNFWATWCPPCRDEIPSMDKLNRQLKDKGFMVLSVSVDRSLSAIADFIKKAPVSFPVLIDDKQKVTKSLYKVYTIPTTFLINRNGIIVEKFFGEHDWTEPEMVKKVEALF